MKPLTIQVKGDRASGIPVGMMREVVNPATLGFSDLKLVWFKDAVAICSESIHQPYKGIDSRRGERGEEWKPSTFPTSGKYAFWFSTKCKGGMVHVFTRCTPRGSYKELRAALPYKLRFGANLVVLVGRDFAYPNQVRQMDARKERTLANYHNRVNVGKLREKIIVADGDELAEDYTHLQEITVKGRKAYNPQGREVPFIWNKYGMGIVCNTAIPNFRIPKYDPKQGKYVSLFTNKKLWGVPANIVRNPEYIKDEDLRKLPHITNMGGRQFYIPPQVRGLNATEIAAFMASQKEAWRGWRLRNPEKYRAQRKREYQRKMEKLRGPDWKPRFAKKLSGEVERIIQLARMGLSYKEIAKELGVHDSAIGYQLKKHLSAEERREIFGKRYHPRKQLCPTCNGKGKVPNHFVETNKKVSVSEIIQSQIHA